MSMCGCGENSCSMTSIGKSGSKSCGPSGACVCGFKGGASGSGSDGSTLSHAVGIWLSASRNLECPDIWEAHCSSGPEPADDRHRPADYGSGLFRVLDL